MQKLVTLDTPYCVRGADTIQIEIMYRKHNVWSA